MMRQLLILVMLISLLFLGACQQSLLGDVTGGDESVTRINNSNTSVQPERPLAPGRFAVTKTEGDLVILAPEAIDPDGDRVSYTFSAPFDEQGKWQTSYGDAGNYFVTVTAEDSKGASTTEVVNVTILHADRAPSLKCPGKIVAKEGETISLDCQANDEEGTDVTLTYFGWMTAATYTTTFEDAGKHEVRVKATDGAGQSVEQTVQVTVLDSNRGPIFPLDFSNRIEATEGDVITIPVDGIYDPDGDKVSFTFSEPFDEKGTWVTKIGDAGTYPVDVVASDGTTSVKEHLTVEVGMVNTAPVLKRIPDIRVYEGETIEIPLDATDREGDALDYEITGWLDKQRYTTTYQDAGTYTTKVTVSDGQFSDSQVIHITVIDRNRPPAFVVPA